MTTEFVIVGRNDTFRFTNADGGSLKSPTIILGDSGSESIRAVNFNGYGIGVMNDSDLGHWDLVQNKASFTKADEVLFFRRILARGPIVPPLGYRHSEDLHFTSNDGWLELIPDSYANAKSLRPTSRIPDSNQFHYIENGAMLIFLTDFSVLSFPPEADRITLEKSLIAYNHLPQMCEDYPRLKHLLQTHEDNNNPIFSVGEKRDMGWLLRYHNIRTGSKGDTGSWFWSFATRDAGGIDNYHYYKIMHTLWNWVLYPEESANSLPMAMIMSIYHAGLGRVHVGKFKGKSANEKGTGFFGDGQNPVEEKCFDWNLLYPYITFYNTPLRNILEPFVMELLEFRLAQDPNTVSPNGEYDNRVIAYYLENLLALRMVFPQHHVELEKKMANRLDRLVDLWDATNKHWPNPAATPKGQSSPWMGWILFGSAVRICEFFPGTLQYCTKRKNGQTFSLNWLLDRAEEYDTVAWEQDYRDNGIYVSKYRIYPDVRGNNIHRTANAIPMYRRLASHRPEKWRDEFDKMLTFITTYADSYIFECENGAPSDLRNIGHDYPTEGSGHPKVVEMYAMIGR